MEEKSLELQVAQDVPEKDGVPVLTLDDVPAAKIETVIQQANELSVQDTPVASQVQQESVLTEKEKKVVDEFSKKIDITNATLVLQYGTGAQKHIANFSEGALANVRNKDMGSVGDMLTNLVVELKGFNGAEKKGLAGLFQKPAKAIAKMKAQYTKVEGNIDDIVEKLEHHQVTLLKDIALFGKMYEMNTDYFKELTMYIEAGKLRIKQAEQELEEMKKKASDSGKTEDAQAVNDYSNLITRFEKRLYDLELTRTISLQMGPQIRLLQNNDSLMAEKINSSIVNTIPLWKSQMVLALGLENSRQAIEAQKAVTEMTNQLLKENSEMLKMGTIEAAKEGERGIVEIETLQKTNEDLISTIESVLQIQKDGKAKRAAAETQLGQIENELKQKLLQVAQNS